MSKLRSLLDKVGDIKILNQNGFWSIQFENGTICDYLEALHLYNKNNSQDLEKLLELLLRGMMLPNIETDWSIHSRMISPMTPSTCYADY